MRDLRVALDMTQGDLSRAAGVTPETVSHYERGRVPSGVIAIVRIARALGTTVDDLIGSTEIRRQRRGPRKPRVASPTTPTGAQGVE